MTAAAVRRLVRADLAWVVDLAASRRARLAPFAPRFWKPAPDARTTHAGFLGGLIDSPAVLSVRTGHGFLFGLPRNGLVLVDDLALSADEYWPTEGEALLRCAAGSGRLRVVCPVPEAARRAAATAHGLTIVETWWHRDLDVGGRQREGGSSRPSPSPDSGRKRRPTAGVALLRVSGAEGQLVPAPPIYAPGGPVLLVSAVGNAPALRALERLAALQGAPVSVVALTPEEEVTAAAVEQAGYRRITDFLQ